MTFTASSLVRLSRRAILAAALLIAPAALQMESALAATPAEAWVSDNIQRGLGILNKKQPAIKRRDEFRVFLLGLIDIRAVATYTMGIGKRTSTPQQQEEFIEAFKDYASAVYESYLLQYSGQTLRVTSSMAVNGRPNETIVRTILVDPKNPNAADPFKVDFRVAQTEGRFQVKDASVEGIWLAILEHDDFDAYLGANGNNLPKLTEHLHKLTKDLQK